MRIRTYKVRSIEMTREEHDAFMKACEQAREGRTVHSGAVKLEDGSCLQVTIESEQEKTEREARVKELNELQRRRS